MDNCPVCQQRINRHAKQIACSVCTLNYHLKCITLCKDEITNNGITVSKGLIDELSELVFHPFELNDDNNSPWFDIDPDLNFYNQIDHAVSNCNYYMEDMFNESMKEKKSTDTVSLTFSLCHLNIRSNQANMAPFHNYLGNLNHEFSIIGMSETWLQDHNCDLFHLPSYNLVERVNKKGDGVAIFLKDTINFQRREDLILDCSLFDSVFIEVDRDIFQREKNIIIGVIYRPPDADLESFIELMGVLFEIVKRENKMCYLMGDYNTNFLNYDKHNLTTDFVDLFHSY